MSGHVGLTRADRPYTDGQPSIDFARLLTFLAGLIVGLLLGTTIGVLAMAALAASSRNRTD